MLTTDEVAELLRVHPKHVYRLLKKGLPARRVGAEWRFDRADVLRWAGAPAPAPEPERAPAVSEGAPSVIAANGDLPVLVLLRLLVSRGPPLVGLVQTDMARGLALLDAGAVLATGAHAGGFPTHVGGERLARVHLVRREVGLASPAGRPLPELAALSKLRLASRPGSAGIRAHLDAALRAARLKPESVHRRSLLLESHLEVVAAVSAGRADVGLASRGWAERLGLSFRTIATEAYGLLVKARDLGDARIVRLCEVAQGTAFREAAAATPGYDAAGSGEIRYDPA
ncbi:MAG TPA: helix-turn-helix transcriptional regulator [Anaeromyxobacteraceae bacterium]|nr:helix-turn-helix transcriptional regulator [Anaeromyxobacteraceae bacterium]